MSTINAPTFLLHPNPQIGEGFMGYAWRVAQANYYHPPSQVLEAAGLGPLLLYSNCAFLFDPLERYKRFAQLTRHDLRLFRGMVYELQLDQGEPTEAAFYGQLIPKLLLRPELPRICPRCLYEFNYVQGLWDLILFTACPYHRCRLFNVCPACGKEIRWFRRTLFCCQAREGVRGGRGGKVCGFDFRRCPPISVKTDELTLARLLFHHFGMGRTRRLRCPVNLPLGNLSPSELIKAIVVIAGCLTSAANPTISYPKYLASLSLEEHHAIFTKAYNVFENWPQNYLSFLKSIDYKITRNGFGFVKDKHIEISRLRRFGNALHQPDMKLPAFDFMRTAFEDYMQRRTSSHSDRLAGVTLVRNI